MNLSPHFTLEELTFSQIASRKNLDNTPTADIIENLKLVAVALEAVRTIVGRPIIVSSGYRSYLVNKAAGGALNSAHMSGLAADINVKGMDPSSLAHIIKVSQIPYDQLILEYDAWVHVGVAKSNPRHQLLTIRNGSGYMKGLV